MKKWNRALQNKYLPALMIGLLCALSSQAQHWQNNHNYFEMDGVMVGQQFYFPIRDTNWTPVGPACAVVRPQDTLAYYYNGRRWIFLGGGNGSQGPATWGNIYGNINTQNDIINLVNTREPLLTLGADSQYYKGNKTLGYFKGDVLRITDPTYSKLGHTHNPNDIIGLTDYIRGTISVIGNGTYNSNTGVINITGSGTGTSYTFASPMVNDGSGHISIPSVDASLITSGTKSHTFINDFDAYSRNLFSALLPLGYNQATGAFSVDTTNGTYGLSTHAYVANYVATHTSGAAGVAGGDLSGNYPNPTVAKLNGQLPSYYLSRANHTGTQLSSTISDFTTGVQGIGDVRYLKPADTVNKWQPKGTYVPINSNGNVLINTTVDDGHRFRVVGPVEFNLGGDQYGDMYYRDSLGSFHRIPKPASAGTKPVLTFRNNLYQWTEDSTGSSGATGTAGGDLTGTYPNPTLASIITPNSCTNCNMTYDAKGRILSASNGTGGSGGYSVTTTDTSHWNSTYRNSLKSTTIRNSLASGLDSLASTPNDSTMILKRISVANGTNISVSKVITDTTIVYTPSFSGVLPIANGGTGTTTPGLVQGANVTITGSWPNQTVNASATVTGTEPLTINSASSYTVLNTDYNVINANAGATSFTLPSSPLNGQVLYISNAGSTITFNVTVWDSNVTGTTTLAGGHGYKLIWNASASKWYHINTN